ncbi:alpha/beta hydrolase [Gordonia sp. PS3]|uniref:Putative hydrolase n=2 Tax=Gordonia TaxID=2053 RepID=L7LQS0_9ACTN|nr:MULTISPECIES: alpha/beta hydrolase [Gordonia]AUH67456.1 alpha/beta hydrolase [Gordonia sp. YC-JH1]WFN92887.1 alpha/beta hydrolase [Gordonia sihwensis]GAC62512.1 putative hydrolase [Gordonia sihwensis NBRC 108236]
MVSIPARLTMASLRATRSKKFYADPAVMTERLPRHQRKSMTTPPWLPTVQVSLEHVGDMRCYRIEPRDGAGDTRILHLHGGGFVEEPQRHHWRFLAWLARAADASVIMPIYPLCPSADHRTIIPAVADAAHTYLAGAPGPTVLSGDSAGGRLALELCCGDRRLRTEPDAVVLLSPWIDLTVSMPEADAIDPDDPELGIAGLRQAGRWFAGNAPPTDFGPVDGERLSALPPTIVFTGTRDVLNPDARDFVGRARSAGATISLKEHPGMFHNWIMHKIPEASRARRELEAFISERLEDGGSHLRGRSTTSKGSMQ